MAGPACRPRAPSWRQAGLQGAVLFWQQHGARERPGRELCNGAPTGQGRDGMGSFCRDKEQLCSCSEMFSQALGSSGAVQAGSWNPVTAHPPVSLYSLSQLIPSQILLCHVLTKRLRQTRLSLWGGERYDPHVSLRDCLRRGSVGLQSTRTKQRCWVQKVIRDKAREGELFSEGLLICSIWMK